MNSVWKITKAVALIFGLLLLITVGGLLALRTYRQHENTRTMEIRSANGIDEGRYVKIGGIDQWIQIRGQDRNNPVLLCLHGGPGGTWIPYTALFLGWEKDFTVVLWDQRGAGKTLESTGDSIAATMTVDRMAQDGIEVAEYLRNYLHKDKIVLLGHSWGSILGIHMAKQRPELFSAYVGTGQVSDMAKSMRMGYEYALDKARAAKDNDAVREIEGIGPPPFDNMRKVGVYFTRLGQYEVESKEEHLLKMGPFFPPPNFSLWDEVERVRGFLQVPTYATYREMMSTNLSTFATEFQLPIYFFQGTEDQRTPYTLAKEYFDRIQAPRKEFVALPGGGHFAVWSMRTRFLRELDARVR
jgi:pimeloyl-ACP methyl ester carboxylesterase